MFRSAARALTRVGVRNMGPGGSAFRPLPLVVANLSSPHANMTTSNINGTHDTSHKATGSLIKLLDREVCNNRVVAVVLLHAPLRVRVVK
jgi:hypothetical protein